MEIRDVQNWRVIFIGHDADFSVAPVLRRQILVESAFTPFIIVTLETCDYCDVASLSAILHAKRWLRHRLAIVIPLGHVARKIATILDWTDALESCETLADAFMTLANPDAVG